LDEKARTPTFFAEKSPEDKMCSIEHVTLKITGLYADCILHVNKRFLERVRRGVLIGTDIFSFTLNLNHLKIKNLMNFENHTHDPDHFLLILILVPKKRRVRPPFHKNHVNSQNSKRNMHLKIEICIKLLKYT